MFEYQAKSILEREGLRMPDSLLLESASDVSKATAEIGLPMVMKVQTLVGGRGKAGGILVAESKEEAENWYRSKLGTYINENKVEAVMCEEYIPFDDEYYISFSVDTKNRKIDFLFSTAGGVDIETNKETKNFYDIPVSLTYGLEDFKLIEMLSRANVPKERWNQIINFSKKLYELFMKYDCLLLEINPLVWAKSGELRILDIHLYIDDNAVSRQEDAKQAILAKPDIYPQSWLKTNYGFDMVVLNPNGNVGLLSTGAGLSMAVVDEMKSTGLHPINFADVRSGQLKGDPTRLIVMLERISEFPNLKYIFVSIFAGITDLAEFAESLLKAKDAMRSEKNVEWIIRLEGNNFEKAKQILEEKGLFVTNSLQEAIGKCVGGEKRIERIN